MLAVMGADDGFVVKSFSTEFAPRIGEKVRAEESLVKMFFQMLSWTRIPGPDDWICTKPPVYSDTVSIIVRSNLQRRQYDPPSHIAS